MRMIGFVMKNILMALLIIGVSGCEMGNALLYTFTGYDAELKTWHTPPVVEAAAEISPSSVGSGAGSYRLNENSRGASGGCHRINGVCEVGYDPYAANSQSSSSKSNGKSIGRSAPTSSGRKGTTCHDGTPATMAYDPETKGHTQPVCEFKGVR